MKCYCWRTRPERTGGGKGSSAPQFSFDAFEHFPDAPGVLAMPKQGIVGDPLANLFLRCHDGAVIAAAEVAADIAMGGRRVFAREVHRQHPWMAGGACPTLATQGAALQTEHLAHGLVNLRQLHC